MDVNQLCLFLFVTLRLTEAIQTYVEYEFNFECGKQPVTGELIVEKGGSEILRVEFKRDYLNEFKESRQYLSFPTGAFKLILNTGCGALSKIGEMCFHKYTVQPFVQQHGSGKYLLFMDNVDISAEIGNRSSTIELICK